MLLFIIYKVLKHLPDKMQLKYQTLVNDLWKNTIAIFFDEVTLNKEITSEITNVCLLYIEYVIYY